ncbi:MAG: phosphopantetheine-binding protein [Verrucomicrobiota bacterium]
MTQSTIETQLKEILAEVLELSAVDLDDVKPSTTLEQLGADSLDGVELGQWIEDEFDIDIEAEVELHNLTFAQLVNLIIKSQP